MPPVSPSNSFTQLPQGQIKALFWLGFQKHHFPEVSAWPGFLQLGPRQRRRGSPDLKINPPWEFRSINSLSLIKQTENKFRQVLGSWT